MTPAAEGLARVLAPVPVSPLAVHVIANVTAERNQDPLRVKDLLVQQVTAPVRWEESMAKPKVSAARPQLRWGRARCWLDYSSVSSQSYRVSLSVTLPRSPTLRVLA